MTKNKKLAKLAALLVALVMVLGSFPVGYNVTNALSEEATEVTETENAAVETGNTASEEEAPGQDAEDEAARKAAEDEAARKAAEEEAARKAAEEEAARKAAEEEAARKAAEDEAARKAAEDEAARKAAEDEAARKAAEDEAARKAAEDEAARKAAEEAQNAEVSEQIGGEPAPEMETEDDSGDDDFEIDEDDFADFDDEEWEDLDEDDGETIIMDDWDAGTVSDEMLNRFNNSSNYEQMEFNGTATIELKNEGKLKFGDEIKLEAKVEDVNLSYRLIWEANDDDDRGWYTIASGEKYSYTLTAENLEREYRVVIFSVD